jgi:hypothetical protein
MKLSAAGLLVLGLARMSFDVLGLPTLAAVAAATGASPAPKVFSSVRGLETYSTAFYLEWTEPDGVSRSLRLTPERSARIRGPYNRRNVYGAVLAYGPVLITDPRTRPMFESVARHALCGSAPLLRELGIETKRIRGPLRVRLEPQRALPKDLPRQWEAPCR